MTLDKGDSGLHEAMSHSSTCAVAVVVAVDSWALRFAAVEACKFVA